MTTAPARAMRADAGTARHDDRDRLSSRAAGAGLALAGLVKTLGGRRIVDGIDLDVAPGELVCLLGPSGCGKTTTLRMIAGFLEPDAGTVTMAGRDVTASGADRRPSAMVFQNYALWPHMTVARNVAFPLTVRRMTRPEIRRRVDEALRTVGLAHHADSRPTAISGGEQQRVALARAIVQEPDVLLLDEPLSNLDAQLRVGVREEIRALQRRLGITTVLVTHDQDEAMSVADRIAIMHDGRIEQLGTPAEVYRSPATRFVAGFIGTTSTITGRFRQLVAAGRSVPLSDEDDVLARPEDVAIVPREGAPLVADVVRRVPHGHFTEIVVACDGSEARAFLSGDAPDAGDRVGVALSRVLVYRDGMLVP